MIFQESDVLVMCSSIRTVSSIPQSSSPTIFVVGLIEVWSTAMSVVSKIYQDSNPTSYIGAGRVRVGCGSVVSEVVNSQAKLPCPNSGF